MIFFQAQDAGWTIRQVRSARSVIAHIPAYDMMFLESGTGVRRAHLSDPVRQQLFPWPRIRLRVSSGL